jgi:hypothetical protein
VPTANAVANAGPGCVREISLLTTVLGVVAVGCLSAAASPKSPVAVQTLIGLALSLSDVLARVMSRTPWDAR